MGTTTPTTDRRAGLNTLLAVLLTALLVACGGILSRPRQGWNPSLGPVVPHDSFPTDCTLCHTGKDWHTIKDDFKFDHQKETGVALNGAHAGVACLMCHNDRGPAKQFAANGCAGCHEDRHQGRLGKNCNDCHAEQDWVPRDMIAKHNRTRFPLVGNHAGAACWRCHPGAQAGNFQAVDDTCANCHQKDLARATNPDHAAQGWTSDCQRCHTPAGAWEQANFVHPSSFPLTAGHAGVACTTCHTNGTFRGTSTACASCHMPDYQRTTAPNHAAAGFSTSCNQCHNTTGWTGVNFVHTSRFPLTNAHAGRSCSDCHTGGVYNGLSSDCVSCHRTVYQNTTNPNHVASGFQTNCTQCHTTVAWRPANFTHSARFPLTAGHAGLSCTQCHTGGTYAAVSTACNSCHMPQYQATTNPNHAAAGFSTNCTQCHSTAGWTGVNFVHTSTFPLTNGHAGQQCTACHAAGTYSGLSTSCATCHQNRYTASTNPSHTQAGFNTTCNTCHTTVAWQPSTYTHIARFPLTGGHAGQTCNACHSGGVYRGLPATCVSCHQSNYAATTNPNHTQLGYSTTCNQCHTTATWLNATVSHPATFPLTNGHSNVRCNTCHTSGVYTGLSTACNTCHQNRFTASSNPNHAQAGFNTTCNTCHTTVAWQPSTNWTHIARFPLNAGHAGRTCNACHASGTYVGLTNTCVSCHLTKYQQTTNPNHAAAGYSTNCNLCHTTTTWLGATVSHPASFPLTNSHAGVACNTCHTSGVYTGLSTACNACHQNRFTASTNPNHTQAGFNTTCNTCHGTVAWQPSQNWTHIARFPLNAGHAGRTCNACHASGTYVGLTNTCVSCHQTQYNSTTNPNHQQLGYSTNCTQCHTTVTWLNASVTHPATFPLTNGHGNVRCNTCHTSGVYTGLSTACNTCHQNRFTASTNPNHTQAGFATTCNTCHTTVAWQPSSGWSHPASFPLSNGHAGQTCNACHASGVYHGLTNTCVSCHQTQYNATTNPNHASAGYGTNCTQCHSTVTWLNATFSHPATFPLTNGHAGQQCNACHTNGVYTGLSTACNSCHNAQFAAATNPNHTQAAFNTTCNTCHGTVAWRPSVNWTHPTAFPLTNGHANRTCNACHASGVYHGLTNTCVSCHQANYNATTNPNHASAGFGTGCVQCHNTTTWLNATFNHTPFVITTGSHRSPARISCTQCHTTGQYSQFSCTTSCHAQTTTNQHHSGVRNYVYASANCYACHPTGRNN